MFSKGREKVHLEKMGWHNFHYYVFVCNKKNRELKFSQLINMRCFARFGTICAILKKEKHTWRSVTFSNTLPRVFFMFFKLYKWYQTAPHDFYNSRSQITFSCSFNKLFQKSFLHISSRLLLAILNLKYNTRGNFYPY